MLMPLVSACLSFLSEQRAGAREEEGAEEERERSFPVRYELHARKQQQQGENFA
jgi:hypothetical protein